MIEVKIPKNWNFTRSPDDAKLVPPHTRIELFTHYAIDRGDKTEYFLRHLGETISTGFDEAGLCNLGLNARYLPGIGGKRLLNNGFPLKDSDTGLPLSYEGRIANVITSDGNARPLNVEEMQIVDFHTQNMQFDLTKAA